eukprot:3819538-Rhodomonas_salina.1
MARGEKGPAVLRGAPFACGGSARPSAQAHRKLPPLRAQTTRRVSDRRSKGAKTKHERTERQERVKRGGYPAQRLRRPPSSARSSCAGERSRARR